jgi:hypothetical protein
VLLAEVEFEKIKIKSKILRHLRKLQPVILNEKQTRKQVNFVAYSTSMSTA